MPSSLDAAPATLALSMAHPAQPGFLSVIIPAYDDAEGLAITLEALRTQTLPIEEFEILVANDGGDAAISTACQRHSVREVALVPNRGSYAARNAALRMSRGEWICFVDANIRVPDHWCAAGRAALAHDDYVGGSVTFPRQDDRTPARVYQDVCAFPNERYLREQHYAPTANLFVRRRVIDEVGGFDERLRSGGDHEFGDRVFRAGRFTQRYAPELAVCHPYRDRRELIKKLYRTLQGQWDMKRLYPGRFANLRFGLSTVLRALIPPIRTVPPLAVARKFSLPLGLGAFALAYSLKLRGGFWTLQKMFAGGDA